VSFVVNAFAFVLKRILSQSRTIFRTKPPSGTQCVPYGAYPELRLSTYIPVGNSGAIAEAELALRVSWWKQLFGGNTRQISLGYHAERHI
jgi:hypothetical protein